MPLKTLDSSNTTIEQQTKTDNSQLWRIKSAMVVYALEETLGEFVCSEAKRISDLPNKTLQTFQERASKEGKILEDLTPNDVVAVTYLGEVLSLAEGIAKGRPEEKHLARLRQLFDILDVFSIRNAVSHANRAFHQSYWYRMAAIATDPTMDKLQFRRVINAFSDAEAGRLHSPPDAWMNAPSWSLPNNLPEQFDHTITGLRGRTKELPELHKLIRNERLPLIAIVAPGGLGKTTLLLEALKEIVLSPQSAEWVDRVLYFSSKTEVLTLEGIITQVPVADDIENIKSAIANVLAKQEELDSLTFDEARKNFGSQRILLCLDNLETILRDESETFDAFYQILPREWRVVVTSRISVNSATTMPLKPLSVEGGKGLARNYLLRRGGEQLSEEELEKIVKNCDMNPLAIRLTIDGLIVGGKSIGETQSIAKQQVIEFSYRNLIEALSPTAHQLLECLFVVPEPVSRTKACSLLQRDLDDIAEAFNQLRGTSLVTRTQGLSEESYTLSSSVRDLLVVRPVNLESRSLIQEELRRTRQLLSSIEKSQQDINPLSREYIPDSAPDEVKVVAADALKVWLRHYSTSEDLSEQKMKLKRVIELYNNQPFLHRVLGLILLRLNDRVEGKRELQCAWEMDGSDVAAGLILATELRKDQELQASYVIAAKLAKDGWDKAERSSPYYASLIIQNQFLSLVWQGKTKQVIESTEGWENAGAIRGTLGTLRATAIRQSVESERDIENIQKGLCSAVDILDEVFSLEGYTGFYAVEGMKLIEQMVYIKKGNQKLGEETKIKFTNFLDKHLVMLCQEHRTLTLEHPTIREWVQEMSTLKIKKAKNPLASERWQSLVPGTNNVLQPPKTRKKVNSNRRVVPKRIS